MLSEASPGSARLLRSQGGIAPSCQGQPEPPNVKGACRNQSMIGFLNTLNQVARTYVDGPITNATGLTGSWDFDITFTQDRAQLKELGAQGISLFDALEKQLGLKLEQKTITTQTFNVVSVNRTPTANAAGIEKILPPPPAPEFEVADVKPTAPGSTQPPRAQILPTGQINASAVPLRDDDQPGLGHQRATIWSPGRNGLTRPGSTSSARRSAASTRRSSTTSSCGWRCAS